MQPGEGFLLYAALLIVALFIAKLRGRPVGPIALRLALGGPAAVIVVSALGGDEFAAASAAFLMPIGSMLISMLATLMKQPSTVARQH